MTWAAAFEAASRRPSATPYGPFRTRILEGLERHGFVVRPGAVHGAREALALARALED